MLLNKHDNSSSTSINLIGKSTTITGDIHSTSDLRIDGKIIGNINIKAKLVVGATAQIEGNINAEHADISGEVNGNVVVNGLLFLKATAKLKGDIEVDKIIIEQNAHFIGTCSMKDQNKIQNSNLSQKTIPKAATI